GIKCGVSIEMRDSACVALLWLLDLTRLCKREAFEAAFRMFVEDEEVPNRLVESRMWSNN
ncbi:hypothetical protein KI387_039238, partial [Taxus chinensis]